MLPKLKQFLVVITGLIVAKIWHDTLPIFIDLYCINISRLLLSKYVSCNSLGMTIGGISAGLFTDSLSPRVVFPTGMFGISCSTIFIMLSLQWPSLNNLFSIFIYSIFFYFSLLWFYRLLYDYLKFLFKYRFRIYNHNYAFLISSIPILLIWYYSRNINDLFTSLIDPNMVFLFIRGALMSISMNAAYVTIGDMYKDSSWLPVASAYLYTALFGCLASLPIIIKYTSKNIFILFVLISLILVFALRDIIPKKEIKRIDFRNYFTSISVIIKSKEFWMVCSVTMVCIGSFYNLMYTFKDASINKDLGSNLIKIQSIGRYSTFAVGIVSNFLGIAFLRISNQNCAQFMYYGMGFVSFGMICLTFLFAFKKLGFISELIFYLICACSGICQPASKASILSVAQGLGPNITGTAQSLTTFSYSFIEFIGTTVIFRLKYPIGCITYLSIGSMLVMFLAINIYRSRQKINSYISPDP